MKLGLRGRLFLVSVCLILAVGSTSAFYLELELRRWLEGRIESELVDHARSSIVALRLSTQAKTRQDFDSVATELARQKDERVSIISDSGVLLGDSILALDGIEGAKNQGARSEVKDALQRGLGVTRRTSEVLKAEVLYVALPFNTPTMKGVLRLGKPLQVVDQAVAKMQLILLIAGIFGLGLAIVVSFLASHLLSRRLRALLARAQYVMDGQTMRARPVEANDEITVLTRSLDRLDAALEEIVNTLGTERDRFEAVLEGMKEAVIAVDSGRKISLTNHAANEYLEVTQPCIGLPLERFIISPDILAAVENAFRGEATELDITVERGELRHILGRVTPQAAAAGCVIVMNDVTRLRRLETMRRDFVANVSHELRTPVSVMRLNSEALRDGAMSDPVAGPKFVDALLRNAERLSDLISDLLHISRIESGQYDIDPVSIPIVDVASEAIDAIAPLAEEKQISVATQLDFDLAARADRTAMEHVLINLMQNAVKYTQAGGHVELRARRSDDQIRIEVVDNGPGIAEKHRPRVFERFYRVDKGRSKHMGGTGLGLAIVKHLVASMDGQVGLLANEPRGSVFWFELPLAHPSSTLPVAAEG
ncbi:MAG: ATP-binding protein [Myxococcota bacterium]|nr:ATP-binding protein [Myxococcota bacterium]